MKYFIYLLGLLLLFSCNSPAIVKKDIKEVAKEVMIKAKNCALITVDSLGLAYARTMDPFLPEEDFTVWMGTNSKSFKLQQIKNNKKVSLYYLDKETGSYVTLQGIANIVNTKNEKEKFWKKEWKNFYKNKTTDYILIKFTPNFANVISEKYSILGDSITWKTPVIKFKGDN
ncbi:MAG: pyridoxamine 5'-phosphate oxidase family protein [Polaribacter sp.]|uniref:pyridoxamine 5'-phosphate oxidase family protein n=1 Tax=Polaribacter sp. TaxID=1920175 RepID=UPI0032662BE6